MRIPTTARIWTTAALLAGSALAHGTHKLPVEDAGWSLHRAYALLFPFVHPAANALLATAYIASVPNIILFFIPSNISPDNLNTMVAFATGGLLGDVFLHLIPHSFFGEGEGAEIVRVDEKRNIVIGFSIFLGFAVYFVLDKGMRVMTGGGGHDHGSHGHSHGHASDGTESSATSTAVESPSHNLRSRKSPADVVDTTPKAPTSSVTSSPVRMTAVLNILSDTVHNASDSLVMATSFYANGPTVGFAVFLGNFMHEIPHQIADIIILRKSGFSMSQAVGSQVLTAGGSFFGALLGIWIAESSGTGRHASVSTGGLWGLGVEAGELVIPVTAGGFLYIAAVTVLPDLLHDSKSGPQAIKEFLALGFGVLLMGVIAWSE